MWPVIWKSGTRQCLRRIYVKPLWSSGCSCLLPTVTCGPPSESNSSPNDGHKAPRRPVCNKLEFLILRQTSYPLKTYNLFVSCLSPCCILFGMPCSRQQKLILILWSPLGKDVDHKPLTRYEPDWAFMGNSDVSLHLQHFLPQSYRLKASTLFSSWW